MGSKLQYLLTKFSFVLYNFRKKPFISSPNGLFYHFTKNFFLQNLITLAQADQKQNVFWYLSLSKLGWWIMKNSLSIKVCWGFFLINASEKWSSQFQQSSSQFQTKQCSAVFSQWVWIWQTFGLLTDASQWPHKCARSWRKYIDVTKVSFLMTMELVGSKHLVQDLLLSFTLYIEQKLIYSHNQLMSDNNILNPRYDPHWSIKLDVGLTLQL